MEKMNSVPNERICDLMDGLIQGNASAQALEILLCDQQAVQCWHAYHVIGDVLRSAELAPARNDFAFLERLERQLALEPARPVVAESVLPIAIPASGLSANASVFRWKMLAGVASFALVGVVGLNLWTQTRPNDVAEIVAQNVVVPSAPTTLIAAEDGAGAMLRDARLDELMAAHRQLGGHSALQMPAGFLRNATFEGPAR
jgi:sigma-E factor negative regulatory protein RseA